MLFWLFVGIVLSAKEYCTNASTDFYNKNYKYHARFYVPSTFDDKDACVTMTSENFMSLYPQYAEWVVDHIIDIENSIDDYCGKYIMGNMIMVNGEWEQQVTNLCWRDAKQEKSNIYGDIYGKALYNVRRCCKIGEINYSSFVIIIVSIFIMLCMIVFYIYQRHT